MDGPGRATEGDGAANQIAVGEFVPLLDRLNKLAIVGGLQLRVNFVAHGLGSPTGWGRG